MRLNNLAGGFAHVLGGGAIFHALWATLVGIIIGALPGLTATMGVALLTTLTFGMGPDKAMLVLICVYVGAIYGGSRSAILLNIPGTPASAASTLDGFPLATQGLAGRAMGISTTGSWFGTLFGTAILALFAPSFGEFALQFGSYEMFWVALFGIVIAGSLSGGDALKGYIAGFIGLFIATIGQETNHAYARFAFGNADLAGGLGLLPVLVGVFGVAEVLSAMRGPAVKAVSSKIDSVIPRIRDVTQYWKTILRSGALGTFIGAMPGLGEDIAAWTSYAAAKRASKEREKYGKGSIEGLMAAETGESACVPGAIIPVLTLAVPGSAPAAVLMAAMMIHGLNPGPMLAITAPEFIYQIVAMLVIADVVKMFYGLVLVRPLLWILLIPRVAADAGGLRAVHGRRLRHHLAAVRHLGDAGRGAARLRAAGTALPDGAAGARHRAGGPARQEPAARAGAVGRRPHALLHAADQHGAVRADAAGGGLVDPGA